MKITKGILGGVKVKPSPNKGGAIKPRLLIVHDTAGALNAAGSIAWLTNPAAKASAHFVVDLDGSITQLVSCDLKAWHAGVSAYKGVRNVNDFSVGIEFVNPGALVASGASGARASFGAVYDRKKYSIVEMPAEHSPEGAIYGAALWMPYPEAQLNAGLAIALALRDAYGITEVARHADISPGRKIDVGPQFPLKWFRGRLLGRQDSDAEADAADAVAVPEPKQEQGQPVTMAYQGRPEPRWIKLTGLGKVHEWPSFFDTNVVARTGIYEVVDVISALVSGDGGINELANVELMWYKVKVGTATDSHYGYVLRNNCEFVEPGQEPAPLIPGTI